MSRRLVIYAKEIKPRKDLMKPSQSQRKDIHENLNHKAITGCQQVNGSHTYSTKPCYYYRTFFSCPFECKPGRLSYCCGPEEK